MAGITRVGIVNHPKIGDLTIDIPDGCRHLILTGPNGSGKSTTLDMLVEEVVTSGRSAARRRFEKAGDTLARLEAGQAPSGPKDARRLALWGQRKDLDLVLQAPGVELNWARSTGDLAAYLGSRRAFRPRRAHQPPSPVVAGPKPATQAANSDFYDWLRHQYLQALLAKVDGDTDAANALDGWLAWFTDQIRAAMGLPDLVLKLDRETYDLRFHEGEHAWWIDEIADGHASILGILGEIVMRLDAKQWRQSPASIEGVVVIDEPETHLHPELEESILPFLTGAFPGLQFIVATHSPIVIASIPDAYVFDLRRRDGTVSAEFAGKKYGQLLTAHFGIETDFDLATTRKLRQLHRLAAADPATRDQEAYERLLDELSDLDHPIVLTELIKRHSAADGP